MTPGTDLRSKARFLVAKILWLWRSVPMIIRATIGGILLAASGTLPWAILVAANFNHLNEVPWAVVPAGLYLWLWWRFASGSRPRSTVNRRRALCRANSISADAWGTALLAGILGIAGVVLLQGVMARLVTLPQQESVDLTRVPIVTLAFWVLMGALVAGLVEETAFRGYMQGPIERRHGPVVAIFVVGIIFGFAHFTHPEVGLILLPYYLAVAAVYGTLAYLTNSILPSLVLHTGGNILGAFTLVTRGVSEWQGSSGSAPLIWQTGPDAPFLIGLVAMICLAIGAIVAFIALAKTVRSAGLVSGMIHGVDNRYRNESEDEAAANE